MDKEQARKLYELADRLSKLDVNTLSEEQLAERSAMIAQLQEVKQRLDPKCWDGYKKQGTKIKGGVRVNNCVPESIEQELNEFAPDGFNGDDGDEFSPEMAKMAYDEGVVKGASLADGATTQRAMAINDWDKHDGGIYSQHFAKGFIAGRKDKIRHNNKQYNLNLKLMKDGSIRHGEQGVAEGAGFDKWADERAASQLHKLKKPHPETWHDVDKKLGKAVDKMSQTEKVKKGLAHPDTLKKKGVAEGSGNIGNQIKALYQKIYDQGDDAIEFMYNDSPIFAQYWDEYEGDLDSIIAEIDPKELQIIFSELQSAAEDQGITEVSTELRNRYVTRASDDYGSANFAARASKSHPGLEDYSREQEARAKKRAAGLGRALSDKRLGRETSEAYTVTRGINRERYQERPGLEGPFSTKSGKVVYYDKVEGKYYDPDTDMYIEYDDWRAMNESDGEYNDEAGMAQSNLRTMARAVNGLLDTIEDNDNLPEWAQEKIAKAEMMVTSVWDYLLSQKEQGVDPKVEESKKPSPKLTPVDIKKSNPVSEEINKEAYERLQKVFAFKNYES